MCNYRILKQTKIYWSEFLRQRRQNLTGKILEMLLTWNFHQYSMAPWQVTLIGDVTFQFADVI